MTTPAVFTISEQQLTDAVIEMAQWFGWKIVHFRPARTSQGWRTAVQGDGIGWPDLFAVRDDRIIAAELKSSRGRVAADQVSWLDALATAGVEVHVWKPVDWVSGDVERCFR